jgi:hypothetical protein
MGFINDAPEDAFLLEAIDLITMDGWSRKIVSLFVHTASSRNGLGRQLPFILRFNEPRGPQSNPRSRDIINP